MLLVLKVLQTFLYFTWWVSIAGSHSDLIFLLQIRKALKEAAQNQSSESLQYKIWKHFHTTFPEAKLLTAPVEQNHHSDLSTTIVEVLLHRIPAFLWGTVDRAHTARSKGR